MAKQEEEEDYQLIGFVLIVVSTALYIKKVKFSMYVDWIQLEKCSVLRDKLFKYNMQLGFC